MTPFFQCRQHPDDRLFQTDCQNELSDCKMRIGSVYCRYKRNVCVFTPVFKAVRISLQEYFL